MKKQKNRLGRKPGNGSSRKIVQGGFRKIAGNRPPDVFLQMPELFMFNMKDYMDSVRNAKSIDFSYRVKLFDMYESAQLDLHLSGVLDKRLRGVTRIPIEFQRDGKPDDTINRQLRSPWFKKLCKDLVMSQFYGFTLVQFYLDDEGDIRYDLINRKHYDPVFHKILKYQGDLDGVDIENFSNTLFVGTERGLGIFAEILPAVLYKRGDMSDWAKFCNIFGMPIREYTYDAGDEDARKKIIADARNQGSNAVYIHPNESEMKLIEAGNKTGSSELYQNFAEYWDSKISIRVLGNTLTTDAKDTGTQALGTVHKEEENDMNVDDRNFLLDILNYDMKPIFTNLGFNVEGGDFVYAHKDKVDTQEMLNVVKGMKEMGLPMDDDWLYETFGIEKPKDYDKQKESIEAQKQAIRERLQGAGEDPHREEPLNTDKKPFKDRLKSFFGVAPAIGADTDF
nr:MAG TPA: portal [Caudoviricetes sp.]